ncbi:hypothetical protein [Pseudomarimonas arenosa]|uniref:DUF3800 domain-containing protein n=1 Tax=Pseudomarimonas arenosa TaxID=2774145 RepID=A0AAW3ZS76_9GAMM|nr:hypothetical protein [Pseudomarimonas arenosa]MBD8528289.1 hypothetical protein [Pseudomarimonas arenosa]
MAAACSSLSELYIEESRDEFFGVDESLSHFESKKVFCAFVHIDVRGYRDGFDPQERFWRTLRVAVEAFLFVGRKFKATAETMAYLQRELDALPTAAPWPPIPDVKPWEPPASDEPVPNGELADEPGTLWIITADDEDTVIGPMFQAITAFVHEKELGEWDGDSRGAGEADISFDVDSLKRSAKRIRSFLRKHWPDREFTLSDQPSDALGKAV